jgi:Domain of unknown function (DUF4189)
VQRDSKMVTETGAVICTGISKVIAYARSIRDRPIMRFSFFLLLAILFSTSAQAQCRQGSGPDQGDGIPWCSPPPGPSLPPTPLPPEAPPQWMDFAAAVVWADSDKGSQFVGVEKRIDEQSARDAALQKCQKAGWENCEVATSIINGVIAIGRDNNGSLRTRTAATREEARAGLLAKCRETELTCKILAVFDGTAEYF